MKGKLTLHSEYILKKFTDDVPHLNLHTFLRNNLSPWKKKQIRQKFLFISGEVCDNRL